MKADFKLPVFALFALGLLLRLPTLGRPLLSDDEAIYATTADALLRGDLLYRDVVDHKPPLIYHVYEAGFAALGHYNTHGAHAFVILSVLVAAAFLLAIGANVGDVRSRNVGLAAAGLFLVFSTTWHDYDALAANCELFLLAPQTAAAWLLLRDVRSPARGRWQLSVHVAVGVLIGISALFKYQGLTFLGTSIGLLTWWVIRGRQAWSRAMVLGACHVAGALIPPTLYLLWCASIGNLDATIAWTKFNFSYVAAGLTGTAALSRGVLRTGMIGGVAVVPYALGLAGAATTSADVFRTCRDWFRRAHRQTGALVSAEPEPALVMGLLWLATSTIAVTAGGRFFGHYFHLILPPLCLLAAPGFCRLWNQGSRHRLTLGVLCVLPALVFFTMATIARPVAAAWDESEPAYEAVANAIDAVTSVDDRIFVWGNSPQLYILARRPMGTRFSFCNYMTGESPGTPTQTGAWNADANQLPESWDMLFSDLDQRRPTLFVDAAAAGWDGYDKFPISRYPRLQAYVDSHYRRADVRAGVVLYRRIP